MTNNNWIPCPPPQPGDYLTRRTLSFREDQHKFRTIRAVILPGHFDGERWNLQEEPDHYMEMEDEGKRA